MERQHTAFHRLRTAPTPCVWKYQPRSTRRKAQSQAEGGGGLPHSLARDTTRGPKIPCGWQQRAWRRKWIRLVLWSLGCHHNSVNSSLNLAEHMGNLYLAYHFQPFLPHTCVSPGVLYMVPVLQVKNILLDWAKGPSPRPGARCGVSRAVTGVAADH